MTISFNKVTARRMTILWEFGEQHPKQVSAYGTWAWAGCPESQIDHARNDQFPHHTVTLARRLGDSDRLRFHSRPLKVTI